jgi:hypothetical protein
MQATANELDREELEALEYVRAVFPNRWKRVIRDAWMDGDYSTIPGRSENLDSILQTLRNTKGPSWLMCLKLPKAGK